LGDDLQLQLNHDAVIKVGEEEEENPGDSAAGTIPLLDNKEIQVTA